MPVSPYTDKSRWAIEGNFTAGLGNGGEMKSMWLNICWYDTFRGIRWHDLIQIRRVYPSPLRLHDHMTGAICPL